MGGGVTILDLKDGSVFCRRDGSVDDPLFSGCEWDGDGRIRVHLGRLGRETLLEFDVERKRLALME